MKKAAKVYMQKIESIIAEKEKAEKEARVAEDKHYPLAKPEPICEGTGSEE